MDEGLGEKVEEFAKELHAENSDQSNNSPVKNGENESDVGSQSQGEEEEEEEG
jgi:hypothetical protein